MARNSIRSIVVTLLIIFAMIFAPIMVSDAIRPTVSVKTGPICPACVCCEPPPPGSCCRCGNCAPLAQTQLPTSQNGSP
ncbi:uncharacterized protein LOC112091941 [Morus notabilis]|uniref:uncharacterized protein LOC112091941 n=1 Tax=Morus notabilis TaxID=981085 RepID=UPI000CECE5B5|nr:uncharacterized protein LOC112091941 [Morus notabilis]